MKLAKDMLLTHFASQTKQGGTSQKRSKEFRGGKKTLVYQIDGEKKKKRGKKKQCQTHLS